MNTEVVCYNASQNLVYTQKIADVTRRPEENFLRYLDLCYVSPAHHNLKTSNLIT